MVYGWYCPGGSDALYFGSAIDEDRRLLKEYDTQFRLGEEALAKDKSGRWKYLYVIRRGRDFDQQRPLRVADLSHLNGFPTIRRLVLLTIESLMVILFKSYDSLARFSPTHVSVLPMLSGMALTSPALPTSASASRV